MKVSTKINLDNMKNLQKAFDSKLQTQVGVFAGKGRSDGLKNAELGAIHEFGSKTKKIPARSFLRMPIEKRRKLIEKAVLKKRESIEKSMGEGKVEVLFESMGFAAEAVIQSAFETAGFGTWAPNKPSTTEQKGSSAPLIDTSQLRSSVTSKVKRANG